MSKQLATAVHLTDESGVVHSFLPGTTPPKWARKLIDNPKAWAAGEETDSSDESTETDDSANDQTDTDQGSTDDSADDVDVPIPPKAGKGSGVEAWRAYADAKGFETDEDIKRDEIIAALEADGIPTE